MMQSVFKVRGDGEAETASNSWNLCVLHSGLLFCWARFLTVPDNSTVGSCIKKLPPKCTSSLVKYLILLPAGAYCELTCRMLMSHVCFPETFNMFKQVQLFAAFTGLACLGWFHLHLAEEKLGLRKKFHVAYLLKIIILLIPQCCSLS